MGRKTDVATGVFAGVAGCAFAPFLLVLGVLLIAGIPELFWLALLALVLHLAKPILRELFKPGPVEERVYPHRVKEVRDDGERD